MFRKTRKRKLFNKFLFNLIREVKFIQSFWFCGFNFNYQSVLFLLELHCRIPNSVKYKFQTLWFLYDKINKYKIWRKGKELENVFVLKWICVQRRWYKMFGFELGLVMNKLNDILMLCLSFYLSNVFGMQRKQLLYY